jgi:hypothetical protein
VEPQPGEFARVAGAQHDERGRAGFRAFNEGTKETGREIDFVKLRQGLARGIPWSEDLVESLVPKAGRKP